jgi:hypothetical protein
VDFDGGNQSSNAGLLPLPEEKEWQQPVAATRAITISNIARRTRSVRRAQIDSMPVTATDRNCFAPK